MPTVEIRRWQRISQLAIDGDELRALSASIRAVCDAPHDTARRKRLRELATRHDLHAALVPLVAIEGRLHDDPAVLAALQEEATCAFEHVERPRERLAVVEEAARANPTSAADRDHLAWVYYLVGSWACCARELEELAAIVAEHDLVLLRAAGRLYRNSGRNDRALAAYRAIAIRKPADIDALLALGELILLPPDGGESPFDPPAAPPSHDEAARDEAAPSTPRRPASSTEIRPFGGAAPAPAIERPAAEPAPAEPAQPTGKTLRRPGLLRTPASVPEEPTSAAPAAPEAIGREQGIEPALSVPPEPPREPCTERTPAVEPVGPSVAVEQAVPAVEPEDASVFASLDDSELEASLAFAFDEPADDTQTAAPTAKPDPAPHTSIEFDAIADAHDSDES